MSIYPRAVSFVLSFQIIFLDTRQTERQWHCILTTGGRGGRNARFLVGDQDDSDEEEEEEGEGSPKKAYFSDPESEESEDKSK